MRKLILPICSLLLLAPVSHALEFKIRPKVEIVGMNGMEEGTRFNGVSGGTVDYRSFQTEDCTEYYDDYDDYYYTVCENITVSGSGTYDYVASRRLEGLRLGMEVEINGRYGVVLDVQRGKDVLSKNYSIRDDYNGYIYNDQEDFKTTKPFHVVGVEFNYKLPLQDGMELDVGVRSNNIVGDVVNDDSFVTGVVKLKSKVSDKLYVTFGVEGNDNFFGASAGIEFGR